MPLPLLPTFFSPTLFARSCWSARHVDAVTLVRLDLVRLEHVVVARDVDAVAGVGADAVGAPHLVAVALDLDAVARVGYRRVAAPMFGPLVSDRMDFRSVPVSFELAFDVWIRNPDRAVQDVRSSIWMSLLALSRSPSLAPAETSTVMTGLVGRAAVILWPQPSIRRSLPPEPRAVSPMMTFSVVLAYMLMTLLSDAAMTAAWSVATRMPLKVAGTTLPGSTMTSSLKFRSQSTELGIPSPSSSFCSRWCSWPSPPPRPRGSSSCCSRLDPARLWCLGDRVRSRRHFEADLSAAAVMVWVAGEDHAGPAGRDDERCRMSPLSVVLATTTWPCLMFVIVQVFVSPAATTRPWQVLPVWSQPAWRSRRPGKSPA